jgi:hypothetical protein
MFPKAIRHALASGKIALKNVVLRLNSETRP